MQRQPQTVFLAVRPVQWMREFAYTPDSSHGLTHNRGRKHSSPVPENDVPLSDEDALPIVFHSVCGAVHTGADLVPTEEVTPRSSPSTCTPRVSLSAAYEPSSRRTRKTRSHIRDTSPSGDIEHGHERRSRHHRMVMDAVVIVRKKGLRGRMDNARTVCTDCSTVSALPTVHPSPPVSRAPGVIPMHDSLITIEREECASSEPPPQLKTSKYFACAATPPTHVVPEGFPLLTLPSSSILTNPACTGSLGFECLPLDSSFDERLSRRHVATSTRLFDDLMIMLKRLKPILIQESVQDDPWKVLIAVRLLNVTTGKAAIPVFCKILSRWPTPQDLICAPRDELIELLRPLGLYNKRARWLKEISECFLQNDQPPNCTRTTPASCTVFPVADLHYPGVGKYALDSLRIFCADDKDAWKHVMPRDKELVRYLHWRWAIEEGKMWYPDGMGVIGDVDVPYLITLVDELAAHYDGAIGGEGYMYHFANDLCGLLSGHTTEFR